MKKNARRSVANQEAACRIEDLWDDDLRVLVQQGLHALVMKVGFDGVRRLLEQERTALCGPRYQHQRGRGARRGGHVKSSLPFGGRRVSVLRPRVVDLQGQEIPLPLWDELASTDVMSERAFRQMVVGVASRKFARSLEPLPQGMQERGTSRSSVSRLFVAATAKRLDRLMNRDISGLDIVAVYLDGLHFREHVVLVAMGLDVEGEKHILGIRDGATENEIACTGLLSDLVVRGLRPDRTRLFVIDGAKGLRRSVANVFGERALVQRCQFHKVRNVVGHLPDSMLPSVRATMRQAYKCQDWQKAMRMLQNLARSLKDRWPTAAASVLEGLEETLTVSKLKLPRTLERSLSTTNPLESVNRQLRRVGHRAARWRGGTMILRWMTAGVLEAERGFRRIKGAKYMAVLVQRLRDKDAALSAIEKAA
jgi:transposase-like protein